MIYLLQSKDGVSTSAKNLAEAKAKTSSGAFSISGYGFCKGSTIARQALRISRDIIFIHFANIDGRGEFRRDPSDVTTALRFINAADVLIMCNVSESNPEETHWDLSTRVDGKAGRVDFVSKSLPEIKAAMKASREKGEIAKETLNSIVVGRNGRH